MLKINPSPITTPFKGKKRFPPKAKRILCADFDAGTCELLVFLLGREGHEVKMATTLRDALQMARNERFDLYVLDIRFEDGLGLELIAHIRAFDPQTPIVIYSSDVRDVTRQEVLENGAQAFLPKLSDLELVMATLTRLMAEAKTMG